MDKLLSREEFKVRVFARDGGLCVVCKAPAVDAHHILDRKLYPDGGYYVSNGASVCNDDHYRCETTELSVEYVRALCGITEPVLPPDFDPTLIYDKWGNVLLEDGSRLKGPLFEDTAVQKLLKKDLWRYE